MYNVIIVDNDPMVSHINGEYLQRDKRFHISGTFADGREALSFLRANSVQLMLLELSLRSFTGLDLMRELIAGDIPTDVIVVTADKSQPALGEALRLGAMEYILKPYTPERLQQVLDKYAEYKEAKQTMKIANQQTVDYLLGISANPAPEKNKTERHIAQCFKDCAGKGVTAKELSEISGFSIVTVRRYLKRLADTGRLTSEIDYRTGGHPRVIYRMQDGGSE